MKYHTRKNKRERYQRTLSHFTQKKVSANTGSEAAVFKSRRASGDTNPDDTFDLNFQSPEL